MGRKSQGEQTRSEIVEAAARCFSLHGFMSTGLHDILEDVSVSKGAFYHHFKSKEDLAIAVLENLRSDYQEQVFEPVRQISEPGERLSFMFSRLLKLNESGQWKNCLLLARLSLELGQGPGDLPDLIQEVVETLLRFWEELIRQAVTAGILHDDIDPSGLAVLIHSTWLGATLCCEIETPHFRLEEITKILQALLPIPKDT